MRPNDPSRVTPPIAAFCDEATPDPVRQIELMQELGLAHVDLRSAWGTDVLDLDRSRVLALADLLSGAAMQVVCLATRIAKRASVGEAQSIEADLLRAYEVAEIFGVRAVRIFGVAVPPSHPERESRDLGGRGHDAGRPARPGPSTHARDDDGQILDLLGRMADSARGRGFALWLECERGLVIDGPEKALAVLRAIDSPALRFIWDAGNMVDLGYATPTDRFFDALARYVGHVHVKDGVLGSPKTCFAGAGDGQIGELAARLAARGYDGAFSLEPNIARLAEFDGDREKAFRGAVGAFRALLPEPVPMETVG